MPSSPAIPWWLALIPLVLGLTLVWFGVRPRRRGTTPHCRRCNYNLTGLDSDRCPECGTPLTPKTVVIGEGRRRPVRIVAGCVSRCPDQPFWVRFRNRRTLLDGEDTTDWFAEGFDRTGLWGASWSGGVRTPPIGSHTVSLEVHVQVFIGPVGQADTSRLCHEEKHVLTAPFEVVARRARD